MSENVLKLDDVRKDVNNEYKSLELDVDGETVELKHVLRIDKASRKVVLKSLRQFEGIDVNEASDEELEKFLDVCNTVLLNVAADGQGQMLVDALEGDDVVALTIMEKYIEVTQPGEASDSPS